MLGTKFRSCSGPFQGAALCDIRAIAAICRLWFVPRYSMLSANGRLELQPFHQFPFLTLN